MPKIIPIRDLRDTSKLSEMCASTNEPIFITKNGYGDMVIMSTETFEKYREAAYRLWIHDRIVEGLNDPVVLDGNEVMAELKSKYGF